MTKIKYYLTQNGYVEIGKMYRRYECLYPLNIHKGEKRIERGYIAEIDGEMKEIISDDIEKYRVVVDFEKWEIVEVGERITKGDVVGFAEWMQERLIKWNGKLS